MNTTLTALGDDLQAAIAADLAIATDLQMTAAAPRPTWWRRKAVAIPAAVVLTFGAGVGTAAAAGLFTPETVATTMVSSSLIFAGTTAQCTSEDQIVFQCTVDATPQGEPGVAYQRGAVYPFQVDGKVAGGCQGQDDAGLSWTCYAGQAAVDQQIIGQDFLGEQVGTEPGRG